MRPYLIFLALLLGTTLLHAQNPHIARLAQELQSSDMGVRRQAAISLGRASYEQSVRLLRQAMTTERNTSIRLEILRALRNIAFLRFPGYRQALAAIGEAADDDRENEELVRLRATEALWEAYKKDLLDPIPFLDQRSARSQSALTPGLCTNPQTYRHSATIPVLGKAALDKSQNETIRLKAIDAIGAIALADIGPAGRDVAEANVRTARLLGVPSLVSPRALERHHQLQINYLSAIVKDPDNSSTLMLQAVKSIGRVKDKSAIPVLSDIIENHQNQAVRQQAGRALSHVMARQYE
jgi:HEAT repeat protein